MTDLPADWSVGDRMCSRCGGTYHASGAESCDCELEPRSGLEESGAMSKFFLVPFNSDGDFEWSVPFFEEPLPLPDDCDLHALALDDVKEAVGQSAEYANHIDGDDEGRTTDGGYMLHVEGAFVVHESHLKKAGLFATYMDKDVQMHTDDHRDMVCLARYALLAALAVRHIGQHVDSELADMGKL